MKVRVSSEWISVCEKHLVIIHTAPNYKPGRLNTKGKYINNGSFVIKETDGGWVYVGYMDQISIIESEHSVHISDSAAICNIDTSILRSLLYKPEHIEAIAGNITVDNILEEKITNTPSLGNFTTVDSLGTGDSLDTVYSLGEELGELSSS